MKNDLHRYNKADAAACPMMIKKLFVSAKYILISMVEQMEYHTLVLCGLITVFAGV